ncbi:acetate--CoA ligase [Croceimicrobium hydrocarbonivorans]|uniref:Acetate--CoA ligase n=1 Tax=Croceimicrobium hydrocarbonivorans TaxID=2761580 RepID=A0A7H0VC17_9FLAO|nr:acetate--CoA ligase [Croceimicrobium hydrocarbonivorans]QNR23265.1 acetate--CoA ligase [Croceimicrobium hydrocarbonivorans]
MSYQTEYQSSLQDPEGFWARQAQKLDWYRPADEVLSTDEDGLYRWFKGAMTNTAYLALDYHVENGRADQVAMYYDSPVTQTKAQFSYRQMRDRVAKIAGGLKKLGVCKGDTVIIYMPMIPEAVMSMLACARLGAVHSVVFGGFAPHELAIRIDDARPKVLITASSGIEVDRIIPYKPMVDKAMELAEYKPKKVVIFQRKLGALVPSKDYDVDFEEMEEQAEYVGCTPVYATDPLYILYTSGTTGKPKGVVRDNGGHAVALRYSMEAIYGIKPGDVYWAASDIGWVVGHSYIVYAPLLTGATTVLFEGKPIRTPDASTFWRVISEYQVKVMFTAPTAIRAIRKEDPKGQFIKQYDLSSLKFQFLAGERCDVDTLTWLQGQLGIPVVDHWWQTESGWPMLSNFPGIELLEVKPGSVSKPVAGYDLRILTEAGEESPAGEEGYVAVKLPLPPGCLPTLWNNVEGFKSSYLERFLGYYFSGDGGFKDAEGFTYITGRVDDIINVAGHRLSTVEMEEVVAAHPDVAECAVIGADDSLKGQIPLALVVCHQTGRPFIEVAEEIVASVRSEIGAVAALKKVYQVPRLPKTRSGKILRKLLRAIVNAEELKIPSTIDDPAIVEEINDIVHPSVKQITS